MDDVMKKVYRAFDPAPLTRGTTSLYVDLDEVRGSSGLVEKLAGKIRLSATNTCQLVTGHRGSGKTTELRQLQKKLESGEEKQFVVFCEADKDVDRNDVDFPDILIAIVRQMAAQLKERAKIELKPGYFKDRWEQLKELLLSDVEVNEIGLEAGLLKFSAAIKSSPDTRAKIRESMEPRANSWIEAANDVISKAVLELKKKSYSGLVIIVDDLDKMVLRDRQDGLSTGEYLFIHREGQLSAFACNMVYTIPISLAYSCRERNIASLYGQPSIGIVPMTKIKTHEGNVWEPGFERFRELIAKRLKKAGAKEEEVFGEGMRDKLIELSGGQPRELMNLVRESIVGDGLPITEKNVERASRNIRHAYARQLRGEHWVLIEAVKKDHEFCGRTEKNDKDWMELLDSRAVLQYVNDKEWYDVNPLVPERKA